MGHRTQARPTRFDLIISQAPVLAPFNKWDGLSVTSVTTASFRLRGQPSRLRPIPALNVLKYDDSRVSSGVRDIHHRIRYHARQFLLLRLRPAAPHLHSHYRHLLLLYTAPPAPRDSHQS